MRLRTPPPNHAAEGDERIRTAVPIRSQFGQQLLLEPPRERLECSYCGKRGAALVANRVWGDLECEECAEIPLPEPRPRGGIQPRVASTRQGYVYFVQAGRGGLVKIGWTTNPEARLVALQTGSPEPLTIVHRRRGTFGTERTLHRKYALLRERGEWFRPAVLDLEGIAA